MKILNNISVKEKYAIIITITSLCLVLVVSIAAVLIYTNAINESYKEQKKDVYIYENGIVKKAILAENFNSPIEASLRGHLKLFHNLFWSSEPYMEYIEKNYLEANKMGDNSIEVLKRYLDKEDYYTTNVAAGYHILVKVDVDAIEIDYTEKPYRFVYTGELRVIRNNDIIIKKLVTTGTIRSTSEEKSIYSGWFIQDYVVKELQEVRKIKQNEL